MHVLLRIFDHTLSVILDVIDKLPKSDRVVKDQLIVTNSDCCVQIVNNEPDDLFLVNIRNGHL